MPALMIMFIILNIADYETYTQFKRSYRKKSEIVEKKEAQSQILESQQVLKIKWMYQN